MNKNEKLRSSLICHYCCLIFENPVKLPCNISICKSHLLDSNGTFLKEFECQKCQTNHVLPMRGLHPNFYISKTIEENAHLSETELDLKVKLENSVEKLGKFYRESDEESNRKEKLEKIQKNVNIQFRQIKINVDHLQQQYEEIENELESLIEKSRNQSIKIITSYNDGSIAMRDIQNPTQFDFFDGKHDGGVNYILVSSDNQKLISGGSDGCIKMWDLKTGLLLKSIFYIKTEKLWKVKCMMNSPQSNLILVASSLSVIEGLDLNTFTFNSKVIFEGHLRMVTCLEFLTDECLLSGSRDNSIKIWNFTTKECIQTIQNDCEVKGIRKINTNKFICGYNDQTIKIWSRCNKDDRFECANTLTKASNRKYLLQLDINLELNLLLCCSDTSINVWRLDDLQYFRRFITENDSPIRAFNCFLNEYLLVGTKEKRLELFCLKTGKLLKIINDHSSFINDIRIFSPK